MWDLRYVVEYCEVKVLGQQLEDGHGRTYKVNVQNVKAMYPINELIECLPDENTFGCAT